MVQFEAKKDSLRRPRTALEVALTVAELPTESFSATMGADLHLRLGGSRDDGAPINLKKPRPARQRAAEPPGGSRHLSPLRRPAGSDRPCWRCPNVQQARSLQRRRFIRMDRGR